jgi:two-component system nitrate/nitrite sensor histidine kinase NarX
MPETLATAAPPSSDSPAGLLAEITADLSSGADVRALLQHFLAPIVQIARARAGAVRMLFDDDQLRLVGELSLPPELGCAGASVQRDCGGCGQALDGDRLAWDPDMSGCSAASRATLAPMGWAHMLAVPLGHRGQVLGVYNLFFDAAQAPSNDVRTVLRSIGELLGLALHNARLETENLRASVMPSYATT